MFGNFHKEFYDRIYTADDVLCGVLRQKNITKVILDEGLLNNKAKIAELYHYLGKMGLDVISYGTDEEYLTIRNYFNSDIDVNIKNIKFEWGLITDRVSKINKTKELAIIEFSLIIDKEVNLDGSIKIPKDELNGTIDNIKEIIKSKLFNI